MRRSARRAVGSFQYTMFGKRLAAHRRDGRGFSFGKIEHPVGTVTVSDMDDVDELNRFCTALKLSQ